MEIPNVDSPSEKPETHQGFKGTSILLFFAAEQAKLAPPRSWQESAIEQCNPL
jgi:hypothetical protein